MPTELPPVVTTEPLAIWTSVKALAVTPALFVPLVVAVLLLICTQPLADMPCTAGLLLPAVLELPLTTTEPGPTPITLTGPGPAAAPAPGGEGGAGGAGGEPVWIATTPGELSPNV